MSKFDELKAAAKQTQRPHWSTQVNRAAMQEFEALATPAAILELLAIQAQLVEALRNLVTAADNLEPQCCIPIGYGQLIDASGFADTALSAAGAQP